MASITTRASKSSPLTHNEVDANFNNLNADKLDAGGIALGSAASPTIKFTGDLNTGIYSPGADQLAISTNGSQRVFVDSTGRMGVGTSSPSKIFEVLDVAATSTTAQANTIARFVANGSNADANIQFSNGVNHSAIIGIVGSGANIYFAQDGTERARIDSSGRLLVGTSSASNFIGTGFGSRFQVQESTGLLALGIERPTNDTSGPSISFRKTRATSAGGVTVVQNGDNLAELRFSGTDGTGSIQAAGIIAAVDGTPGTDDMPGRLVFSTTADGAATPTERMRITSVGTTTITSAAATSPFIAKVSTSEVARIDGSGRLLVGTSTYSGSGVGFEIEDSGNFGPQIRATAKSLDEFSPYQIFRKSRGTSIVNNNDFLSYNQSEGFDGTNFLPAAAITCQVDGTPGTNDMPGRIVFSTTADGAASPTERLRITSAGNVGIGISSPGYPLTVAGQVTSVSPFGSFAALQTAGGTGFRWLLNNDGTFRLQRTTDGFSTAANPIFVNSSDQVGLNTTTPTATLDVNSDTFRLRVARTPASAAAAGAAGEICWDANYIYVCTATNTWRRTAISSW